MNESSNHKTNGTRDKLIVKEKRPATADKKTYSLTIKDRELQALQEAAKEKGLTVNQYIRETLEKALIREGHLPEWWLSRQF